MARTPKAVSELGPDENSPSTIIQRIHGEVPSLSKDDVNPHGGWKYPSIDKYYEEVAPVAFKMGYTWSLSCIDVATVSSDPLLMLWVIEVHSYLHGEPHGDPIRIPVWHHYDGPQTTGMVFSYAEKIFMRTMFKVVTGEKDADASAKVGSAKQPGLSADQAQTFNRQPQVSLGPDQAMPAPRIPEMPLYASLELELSEVLSREDLLAYTTRRNADIIRLRRENPIEYSALLEQYDAIKNKFAD